MANTSEVLTVLSTVSSSEEAERLARTLVEEHLAACVNILPNITSVYRWQGAVEQSAEVLLVIKTVRQQWEALRQRVQELHSYHVPELIALAVAEGNQPYLQWVADSASKQES